MLTIDSLKIVQLPYEQKNIVTAITASLLGDTFNQAGMDFVDQQTVTKRTESWVPTDVIDVIGSSSAGHIEILKSENDATSGHKESALVVIYREDLTVDRDTFINETDEQVFVVNIPYIDKIARNAS